MKKITAVSVVILLCSCHIIFESKATYKRMLANSKSVDNPKMNFDGAYTTRSEIEEGIYLKNPVYFFKNGLVFLQDHRKYTYADSVANDEWIRKYFKDHSISWGTYEIIGDTIKAFIDYGYGPSFLAYRHTSYQGIIKDKDNIVGWHVTKPYPKLTKLKFKENSSVFEDTLDLHFKPLSIKSYMDTVSEKVPFNKYRN